MTFELHRSTPHHCNPEPGEAGQECVAPEMPLVDHNLPPGLAAARLGLLAAHDLAIDLTPQDAATLLVHERALLSLNDPALRAEAAVVLTRVCEIPGGGWDQPAAQEILQHALTTHPELLGEVQGLDRHAGEICGQIVNCLRHRASSPERLATATIDPTGVWEGGDCFC